MLIIKSERALLIIVFHSLLSSSDAVDYHVGCCGTYFYIPGSFEPNKRAYHALMLQLKRSAIGPFHTEDQFKFSLSVSLRSHLCECGFSLIERYKASRACARISVFSFIVFLFVNRRIIESTFTLKRIVIIIFKNGLPMMSAFVTNRRVNHIINIKVAQLFIEK